HGKNKPWVRRPPPLKGDPNKKDASKYCAFHGMHEHTMNNCFARKTHVEELVREGHCTKFVAKQAIQRIEDRDTAKEPPQKVIRINIILADSEECGLTRKKRKRKIKQATCHDQIEEICPEVSSEEGWKPEEDVELIPLDPDQPDRKAQIGSGLSPDEK
ncbi:Hypothetical predicted protein, partial [Prunus dulcis]